MDYAASHLQIKNLGSEGSIEGILAGFNNTDAAGDVIASDAFSRTLSERGNVPLPMLLHHDQSRPIGVWQSWQERSDGLHVRGKLSLGTKDAQEAQALARDGALTGLSIGYSVRRSKVDQRTGENHLLDLDLIEGSLVTIPANPRARVSSVKSIGSARDIAELLRETGISGRKAKVAAGAAWRILNEADGEPDADEEIRAIFNQSAARIAAIRS